MHCEAILITLVHQDLISKNRNHVGEDYYAVSKPCSIKTFSIEQTLEGRVWYSYGLPKGGDEAAAF